MDKPAAKVKNLGESTLRDAIYACLRRDSKGEEFIYRKYYGYIKAVVYRYIKDHHDAEELVNEAFIKGFKAIDRFSVNGDKQTIEKPFMAWLARIATNVCIDHLRAKKQLYLVEDQTELESSSSFVKPNDNLEVADIMRLLDQLPDIQRVIFNLFEVEGFSHEEIATQLNIPESTSRTYLTRAKQKLRIFYNKLYS